MSHPDRAAPRLAFLPEWGGLALAGLRISHLRFRRPGWGILPKSLLPFPVSPKARALDRPVAARLVSCYFVSAPHSIPAQSSSPRPIPDMEIPPDFPFKSLGASQGRCQGSFVPNLTLSFGAAFWTVSAITLCILLGCTKRYTFVRLGCTHSALAFAVGKAIHLTRRLAPLPGAATGRRPCVCT